MANIVNLTGVQAYAQEQIYRTLHSGQFNRSPMLAFLARKTKDSGKLGRPGSYVLIGGSDGMSKAQKIALAGSTEAHVRVHTGLVGGGKWMTARDTTPTVATPTTGSHDNKVKTAVFRWSKHSQPILVWNDVLEKAKGKYEIASAVAEATQMAIEEQLKELAAKVFSGSPADQNADNWSEIAGLALAVDSAGTYGGLARATETYWQAKEVDKSSAQVTLSLIDEANFDQGAANVGPGVDLMVVPPALYRTLKAEALSKNGELVYPGKLPKHGLVGFEHEAIMYGKTFIFSDPNCTATTAYLLTSEDWVVEFHPQNNFRVTSFVDQGETTPGANDAKTAMLKTELRMYCTKPWRQVKFTNVVA